jgi:hypothetical protein
LINSRTEYADVDLGQPCSHDILVLLRISRGEVECEHFDLNAEFRLEFVAHFVELLQRS